MKDMMHDALRDRRSKNFELTISITPEGAEQKKNSDQAPPPAKAEIEVEQEGQAPEMSMEEMMAEMPQEDDQSMEGLDPTKMSLGQRARMAAKGKLQKG